MSIRKTDRECEREGRGRMRRKTEGGGGWRRRKTEGGLAHKSGLHGS